jgi:uncharacterized protein YecE (DUF72 family)
MSEEGNCHIGTSGWSYPHWKGVFYPHDVPSALWLPHYASRFDTVEINASFYRVPAEKTFLNWRDATPDGFVFAVKVDRRITHYQKLREVRQLWESFVARCALLGKKLGCLLLQFPPSFHLDLQALADLLCLVPSGMRCAFEFRHQTWFAHEAYHLLSAHGAALCRSSAPRFPDADVATADFVYVRMHGGTSLYSSKYSDAELRRWSAGLRKRLKEGRDVYVYFNNDAHGYAVENALTLRRLLQKK